MHNNKIQEGLDSINRIKLIMGYNLEKTLNENKSIILKEDINSFPWCVRFGNAWPLDPKNQKSKEYTSVKTNGSGGFESTGANYQNFNTPYIVNKETHRFFADGTYWKKSPDEKKWIEGVYKCNEDISIKSTGQNGSILFDENTKPTNKPKKSILPPQEKEEDGNYVMTDWGMKKMPKAEFPSLGDLYDTPEPQEPEQQPEFSDANSSNIYHEHNYIYTRYENKEPKKYYFKDRENGYTYKHYYDRYLNDREKWRNDNDLISIIKNHPHAALAVAGLATLLIPPPVGPALFLAFNVADSGLYYSEGDNYSAGLSLVFAAVPYAGKVLPKLFSLGGEGISKVTNVLKKGGAGAAELSQAEEAGLKELVENSGKLTFLGNVGKISGSFINFITKTTPYRFLRFLAGGSKTFPQVSNLFGTTIQMGGVAYTYDKVYKRYTENLSIVEKGTYVTSGGKEIKATQDRILQAKKEIKEVDEQIVELKKKYEKSIKNGSFQKNEGVSAIANDTTKMNNFVANMSWEE